MQQFVVPQFIDVEDKIFGPVTTRQFLILLVTGMIIFLLNRFVDFTLFIILTFFIGGFSLILAFAKVNGQSFHYFMLNISESLKKPSLRIWKKSYTDKELQYFMELGIDKKEEVAIEQKTVKRKHIHDLSLLVNTGGYYKADDV
ncbi:PrgI family protein [Patescibacteria group bacterium]|nr:PrgI family protein [Patescibacteria group bacterium]MBU1722168.1 PrgI family protein [Patescibacteria group bacterium]MBU1901119.1 PrgI family protein [Patescibacteria group bacterium]